MNSVDAPPGKGLLWLIAWLLMITTGVILVHDSISQRPATRCLMATRSHYELPYEAVAPYCTQLNRGTMRQESCAAQMRTSPGVKEVSFYQQGETAVVHYTTRIPLLFPPCYTQAGQPALVGLDETGVAFPIPTPPRDMGTPEVILPEGTSLPLHQEQWRALMGYLDYGRSFIKAWHQAHPERGLLHLTRLDTSSSMSPSLFRQEVVFLFRCYHQGDGGIIAIRHHPLLSGVSIPLLAHDAIPTPDAMVALDARYPTSWVRSLFSRTDSSA